MQDLPRRDRGGVPDRYGPFDASLRMWRTDGESPRPRDGDPFGRPAVREREWDKSMPAYKRMRDRGLQPPSIESATALENEVGDQTDINHRDIIPRDTKQRESMRRRIGETQEAIASHPGIVP
jgi:hypothetical protein